MFSDPVKNDKNYRLLNSRKLATSDEWRFDRTGWTDIFVLDNYIQLIMILLCWIMLAVCKYAVFKNDQYGKPMSRVYSLYHKIH